MARVSRIDHVAITVSDLERSAAWYHEVLGLQRRHVEEWGDEPPVLMCAGFEEARAEFETRGLDPVFADHDIAYSVYIHDPDGHRIEVTTYEI